MTAMPMYEIGNCWSHVRSWRLRPFSGAPVNYASSSSSLEHCLLNLLVRTQQEFGNAFERIHWMSRYRDSMNVHVFM